MLCAYSCISLLVYLFICSHCWFNPHTKEKKERKAASPQGLTKFANHGRFKTNCLGKVASPESTGQHTSVPDSPVRLSKEYGPILWYESVCLCIIYERARARAHTHTHTHTHTRTHTHTESHTCILSPSLCLCLPAPLLLSHPFLPHRHTHNDM